MWNFKNIKFAFLVLGILSSINIVWIDTEGFDSAFRIFGFGYDKYAHFSVYGDMQLIIASFMPYIFMRIWEAYYR
jgi:hypothetical protein